jgi:hypothetical protein
MNHIQRLHDLSLCLNNRDDITIAQTVRNLEEGKPAFWYRGRTSGATWVVDLSHAHGSFLKALEAFVARKPNVDVLEILDGVIPLNAEAVHELALAYRLQSTFRDDLADRERRAIFDPEYFPGMSDEMRGRWAARYQECQQRWAEARLADMDRGVGKTAALAIALANIDDAARVAVEGEPVAEVA